VVVRAVLGETLAELGRTGYAALRVEDIAARVGVNKTTIYRRWSTKEELVRAAIGSVVTDEAVRPVDTGSLRGDLLEFARRALRVLRSPRWRAVLEIMVTEGPTSDLTKIAQSLRDAADLPHPLETERSRAALAPGIDPRLVEEMLLSFLVHRVLNHEAVSLALVERVVDVLLCGAERRDAPSDAPTRRLVKRARGARSR
jgi:AcrR family transcriptional regulator